MDKRCRIIASQSFGNQRERQSVTLMQVTVSDNHSEYFIFDVGTYATGFTECRSEEEGFDLLTTKCIHYTAVFRG